MLLLARLAILAVLALLLLGPLLLRSGSNGCFCFFCGRSRTTRAILGRIGVAIGISLLLHQGCESVLDLHGWSAARRRVRSALQLSGEGGRL